MRESLKSQSALALILSTLASLTAPLPARAAAPPAVASAAATQLIAIESKPEWVHDRQLPEASKTLVDAAQNGTAYLLDDEQFRTRADGHDDWDRLAIKITNRSGLEPSGQITLNYNPSFESIGVYYVHLIRDGKVIDLTHETQFRVVEHEEELDDGIVNGTLKAVANLRDVRVGDIVDYATITHTRSSLWPGQAFYRFSERYSEPLAARSIRLIWPAGLSPRYKAINSTIAFAISRVPEGTEWEWTARNPPAMKVEDNVPVTAFQWGRVDVSTMNDWAELARWANRLYQGDKSLPADFSARLDAIAKASPSPADRLTAATRYVQDNIRYVGEELGEGSYVPRRPSTVLLRGYGDCKDKSLLLAVALRRLGIDAVPALVSTRAGERLPDRLPSPLQFNHVIVRAVIDGRVMWIDATGAHRGGRGTAIVPSDLGYALPIRAGQAALEKIDGYADHAGRATVVEQFAVDEAADTPLTLHVETHFTDARADDVRAQWAASSRNKIAENNLAFYRSRFPDLAESKPIELDDDRDGNVLTMVENYAMSREAFSKANIAAKLITRAYMIQNVLPERQANPRIHPLALNDYTVNDQTIELRVKDRVLEGLGDVDMKAGQVVFSRKTTKLPDGLQMKYQLDTGAVTSVPASDAAAVYAVSDKIKDELGVEFYLEKAPHPSSAPKGIDATTWGLIKADIEKVAALTEKNNEASNLEALSLLATASGKVPHPSPAAGLIDGFKGAILSDLHRPEAALAGLQSAVAQYDGNPEIFRLLIGYELERGTGESVARAMQRARQAQPQVVASLDKEWVRGALQKAHELSPEKRETVRGDICIALVGSGWQQDPRSPLGNDILGCAILAYSQRGNLAEARANLAKNPATDTLLSLAIDRHHEALWPAIDGLGRDGFRKNLETEAARATASAKATPKDYQVVADQMRAFRALGRFQDAISAGKALASDKAQIEVAGNDAFWFINEYAANFNALGRVDEAIAAMDGVLALGVDRYPELGSLTINRAEMSIATGHYQEAIQSLTRLEEDQPDSLSAYGKMWIWANKACALRAAGRIEEAKAEESKLAAKPEDNWSAATAVAACRNDVPAVADLIVKRLRDSDARPGALGLFIQFGTPEARTPHEKQVLDVMTRARALPEVQAEFAKYGRTVRYFGTTEGWSDF